MAEGKGKGYVRDKGGRGKERKRKGETGKGRGGRKGGRGVGGRDVPPPSFNSWIRQCHLQHQQLK